MKVKKGDIIFIDGGNEVNGNIQEMIPTRPYLVVSNDTGNHFSNIVMAVPLTSKWKKIHQPTHTIISYNNSMVLCEQIITISQDAIREVDGSIGKVQLEKVDECIKNAFGIN